MSSMRVAVLMSTYNGVRHLEAQLDSLRAQENVEVRVHVRDDGSTDGTVALLERYAAGWPGLASPTQGANLGPAASFLELLRTAPDDADYYAFCDQDDIWLPGKLARAVQRLADVSQLRPALYCSNVTCVDDNLAVLGRPAENGDARLQHLLFENIAYGCTTVMNRAAREIIAARPPERGVIMHDWWCALAVAALGEVHYDPEPHILYRQHGGNAIGARLTGLAQAAVHARRFILSPKHLYPIHGQATELHRLFGDQIAGEPQRALERLASSRATFRSRLQLAVSTHVIRTRPLERLAARGLILADLY